MDPAAQKRPLQSSITSFFHSTVVKLESPNEDPENNRSDMLGKQEASCSKSDVVSAEARYDSTFPVPSVGNDISSLVGRSNLSDADRLEILNNLWAPEETYKFPVSKQYQEKGRNLRFQHRWLSKYKWLAYSAVDDGAYCKYCVLFSKSGAGINFQPLGALCKKKYSNWKKAIEYFEKHSTNEYHKNCILDADMFLSTKHKPDTSVENLLDSEKLRKCVENRKNLVPIIETIILCGRQELALRGRKDYGVIHCEEMPDHNEGNFRAILRYRARADAELKSALESHGQRNKYTSPTIQNEIIESCNVIIIKKLVENVNKSKCFSVLFDETADISGTEQASLCVRYVDMESQLLREDFLQFIPLVDLSGKGIASCLLEKLKEIGIDTQYLRGQGYDGAPSMSGKLQGVQAVVRATHPTALYVHCSAHCLNLAVSAAAEVQAIRNSLGTIGTAHNFFRYPKRKGILSDCINNSDTAPGAKTLKKLCATRWIERFDAVSDFLELLEPLIEALAIISSWPNDSSGTATEANSLMCSVLQCEFLISLLVIAKVFALGRTLSKILQKPSLCLREAMKVAEDTRQELEFLRSDATKTFRTVFDRATEICEKLNVPILVPRVVKNQKNRPNYLVCDPEEYYRVAVFVPFLDCFITELKLKFTDHKKVLSGFSALFPVSASEVFVNSEEQEEFKALFEFYMGDMECGVEDGLAELSLWRRKAVKEDPIPSSAMEALQLCNKDVYRNMNKLLKILATLPVSTATAERSFSTLKRIKTYLRNSTGQTRLNGLALLSIHRSLPITPLEVIDNLAKKKKKLDMSL